jgi:hypothetical protein
MSDLRSRRASSAFEKHCDALRDPHLRVALRCYAGRHGRVVSIRRAHRTAGPPREIIWP